MAAKITPRDIVLLLLLAVASVLVNGYHYGHQDGAIYLPAIKQNLDPSLYPLDAEFFLAQTRWTLFDELVAASVQLTRLPLDLSVFLWHLLSVFLVLLAGLLLARRCFAGAAGQWGAVGTTWAALLLPVAGTQIHLVDRYLHPRDLATAAILFAFIGLLDRRPRAFAWLAAAAAMHVTFALFGAFHLAVQGYGVGKRSQSLLMKTGNVAALIFLAGFFSPVQNAAWHEVLASRPYLFPLRWHWYELLGVIAPLALLAWFRELARRRGAALVEHISRRGILAGVLGVAGSIAITTVPAFERFIPMEPMRTLHFVYFLMVFIGGGLLAESFLRDRGLRWLLVLAPVCVAMFLSNRLVYPSSPHIEWPGQVPKNAWVEAFEWVRGHTPRNALFALDPRYMLRQGEDAHGFRAFAERSALADWVKDRSVTALEPGLAYGWRQQIRDLGIAEASANPERDRWPQFVVFDFRRLKRLYGVSWVVLEKAQLAPSVEHRRPSPLEGLTCPFANDVVLVCRIE